RGEYRCSSFSVSGDILPVGSPSPIHDEGTIHDTGDGIPDRDVHGLYVRTCPSHGSPISRHDPALFRVSLISGMDHNRYRARLCIFKYQLQDVVLEATKEDECRIIDSAQIIQ